MRTELIALLALAAWVGIPLTVCALMVAGAQCVDRKRAKAVDKVVGQ